ncbi:MAG: hypothetical protein JWM11_2586 [Planctomycetaceae bacterium]|nr:hypothetical protein [Planctomycetaceae bacterium]
MTSNSVNVIPQQPEPEPDSLVEVLNADQVPLPALQTTAGHRS